MAEAKRDSNRIPTLLGVSSVDGVTPVNVYVDPVTHRLLIDSATVGTVTSVSVVTANGVSGSVATATTTPAITLTLGAITPSSVNKVTITAPATSATLTIANGKTLTVNNTITFTATDGSTLAIGTGGTLGSAAYTASTAYAASTHASTHAVGGADAVFPADPGADKYLKFNNTSNAIEWADVSGSGANTALSNLSAVAINTSLISDTNNTYDLGSTGVRWKKLWAVDAEITNLPTVNGGTLATALSLGTMASETATNYVAKSLFDANSILIATTDNTPVALTVGASAIVGRKASGDIVALTGAEALTITGGAATGQTFYIGTTQVAINRSSAALTLAGVSLTKRVASTTDDATAVIDCDSYDEYYLTAVANNTEISVTGTPTTGQTLFIGLKDAGVTKNLTWTGITGLGVTLPAATTAGKQHIIGLKYIASAWRAIAVGVEA